MKDKLADLIEAYAAARTSGNRMLLEFAVSQLNQMLAGVDIVPNTKEDKSHGQEEN